MSSPPERTPAGDVTALLVLAREGDSAAADRLFAEVYGDLKRIARRQLGHDSHPTLTPTALVHEVYLRFARPGSLDQNDRGHFFAVAARAMRQILVDRSRRRIAEKRGGGAFAVELDAGHLTLAAEGRDDELVELDAAVEKLEQLDPRLGRVVEMRFFGGMTLEEIAAATGSSERTLKRDWRRARAFLFRELRGEAAPETSAPG